MVADKAPPVDNEPTPEFEARCASVVQEQTSGRLPFREAIARLTIYLQEAIAAGHIANHARAEQLLGLVQAYRGDLATGVQHWERARKLYLQIDNRNRAASMDVNIGEAFRWQGDYERALSMYRAALVVAEEFVNLRLKTTIVVNLGLVLSALGQDDEAQKAFAEVLQILQDDLWRNEDQRDNRISIHLEIHQAKARIALRRGDLAAAQEEAAQALAQVLEGAAPRNRGYADRIVGEVLTALDGPPDSQWPADPDEAFRTSLAAFREINAEAEMAHTTFGHALSLAERGRHNSAARKLQQVAITFARLGMEADAARAAEAQLKLGETSG